MVILNEIELKEYFLDFINTYLVKVYIYKIKMNKKDYLSNQGYLFSHSSLNMKYLTITYLVES